jgi:serine/threonine-protein kinase
MTRNERLIELYYAALSCAADERDRFVADACAGDDHLRDELTGLLAQDVSRTGLLDGAALDLALTWARDTAVLRRGDRVGIYEVVAPIDSGGMGQVYRAHDPVLDRDVAIKVLSPVIAADPVHLARLGREARILASLNHANIASVYRLEVHGDVPALVLELVVGETLAARLAHSRPTVAESLDIAAQLCDALEAAHARGIVHRDLKPANVMITPTGVVKVLDFGLAKVVEPQGVAPLVHAGNRTGATIAGTPAYMSPEQARGQSVDQRADIWAFGCLLYEMLTGTAAFAAPTASDTLVAVLETEPSWQALPGDLAPAIPRLLRRCLHKDAKHRLRDIGDAWLEIREALGTHSATVRALRPSGSPAATRWRAAIFAAVALGGIAGAATLYTPSGEGGYVTRSIIALQPFDQRSSADVAGRTPAVRFDRTAIALSPDGRTLVWQARADDGVRLYRRSLDRLDVSPIDGTEGADSPFFSPDGRWLGFRANGELKRVSIAGGPATTITVIPIRPGPSGRVNPQARIFGATWGDGERIVFATGGADDYRLWVVPGQGGDPKLVAAPAEGEYSYRLPHLLPGGDAVVFTTVRTIFWWDDAQIAVRSLSTGAQKILLEGAADARYVPSGHLVFMRRGTLMAVRFDLARLEITGEPVVLIENVMQAVNAANLQNDSGACQFAVAGGTLVYVSGGIIPQPRRALVWITRDGTVEPLPLTADAYYQPRLSPDGTRSAVFTSVLGLPRVWSIDLTSSTRLPVTTPEERGAYNVWTPDGKRIVFWRSPQLDPYWKSSDGTGPSEPLYESAHDAKGSSWHADGKTLAVVETRPQSGEDILVIDVKDRRKGPVRFAATGAREFYPEFSPDGKWLAYASNDASLAQVYVSPFPGPGDRVQISIDGGTAPTWRRDGRELYFIAPPLTPNGELNRDLDAIGRRMIAVTFDPDGSRGSTVGPPRVLFEETAGRRFYSTIPIRGYDVNADGTRFLMVQPLAPGAEAAPELVLVQNWLQELQRLVPRRARD